MRRKTLNRQQAMVLVQEAVQTKLFEKRIRAIRTALSESRSDLESKQIVAIFEKIGGAEVEDPMSIDEGMWEKAKHMLSKIRIGGTSGSTAEEGELQDLADKEATKEFKELFAQIKQAPGVGDYPNNKEQKEFEAITTGLVMLRQALDSAHKAGLIQTDTANNLIDKVKSYLGTLNKDLSYSYRYLKEDDAEADTTQLDEDLDEMLNEVNLRRVLRLVAKAQAHQAGGEAVPAALIKKLGNIGARLSKRAIKRATRGKDLRPAQLDALNHIAELEPGESPVEDLPPGDGGGGGGGPPDPIPKPDIPDPDVEPPDLRTSDLLPQGAKSTGIGDIGGMQDIGKLYRKAGSVSTLMSWLGPGFLKSLAGFALPVAGIGAVVGLVGKRLVGHSREGGLKTAAKMMTPLNSEEYNSEPQKVTKDVSEVPGDEAEATGKGPDAGAAAAGAAGAKGDVYVFKNPADGQGMQSKFAKSGIKGKDMSRLMKGLRADLSAAGFNVLEEGRETISLENTIAAIEQMTDEAQKEIAKAAIVKLLRLHRIVGDQTASMALKGAEPGAEPEPPTGAKPPGIEDRLSGPESVAADDAARTMAAKTSTGKIPHPGSTPPVVPSDADSDADAKKKEKEEELKLRETLNRWQKIAGIIRG